MKKVFIFLLLTIAYHGQAARHQDCIDAIPVCTNVYQEQNSYRFSGLIPDEIDKKKSCLKDGEKNSVWYVINVQTDGVIGFMITPNVPEDDYDWAVYNITDHDCSDIKNMPELEVSCNFCEGSNNPANKGRTGADGSTNKTHQDENGTPFNAFIPAKEGDTYVILISNYEAEAQYGFQIDFSLSTAMIFDEVAPQFTSVTSSFCKDTIITVRFSENVLCSTIEPEDFSITGPGGPYNVIRAYGDNCSDGIEYDRAYKLVINPPLEIPGQYFVEIVGDVSDVCGNTAALNERRSFNVSELNTSITVADSVICAGDSIRLKVVNTGTEPCKISWTNGGKLSCTDCADPMAYPDTDTRFGVTVTDNNNCTGYAEINIRVKPAPEIILNVTDTAICKGSPVRIIALEAGENLEYSWTPTDGVSDPNSNDPVITTDVTKTYILRATDPESGCQAVWQVKINVLENTKPEITYNGNPADAAICSNDNMLLDAGEKDVIGGMKITSYQWYRNGSILNGETSRFLKITDSGQYSVITKFNGSCDGTDTINITVTDGPKVQIDYPAELCQYNLSVFRINILNGMACNYKWQNTEGFLDPDDAPDPRVVPVTTGWKEYPVIITAIDGGCVKYDTVRVNVKAGIKLDLGGDRAFCKGRPILIEAETEGYTNGTTYEWEPADAVSFPDPGDMSKVIVKPDTECTYRLTVTNENGCSATGTVKVRSAVLNCTVKIPELEFNPRERNVSIPINIYDSDDLIDCTPEFAYIFLSWNYTLFNPMSAKAGGVTLPLEKNLKLQDGNWEVNFSIPDSLINKGRDILAEVIGDVLLGDTNETVLTINKIQWGNLDPEQDLQNGRLRLTGLCEQNGKRLLTYDEAAEIVSIIPNPADGQVTVVVNHDKATSGIRLTITDLVGRIVYQNNFTYLQEGKNATGGSTDNSMRKIDYSIPTSMLKSGVYRITVCAGAGCDTKQFMIVR